MKKQCIQLWSALRTAIHRPMRWTFVVPAASIMLSILAVGLFWAQDAQALGFLGDTVETAVRGISVALAWLMLKLALLGSSILIMLLKFFIVLAGYNGYSTAPVVELGWTLVRDIANMFFIVALLIIAFATILGREDYALKKTLGKLVLMAIFINFSKLIAQVIIDAAHVVTMTFLNALSAVAGGNLIQMFNLAEMRNIVTAGAANDPGNMDLAFQLFGASLLSLMLVSIAVCMLGVYFIIMLYRVVMLWVLIIFSPIAYAAAAIPATASVSKDWWSRFTKNVVSAPMMVFFMWLAFATMGNGAVLEQITDNNSIPDTDTEAFSESAQLAQGGTGAAEYSLSPSAATTWYNMAGFAVAIAFLYAGIERVQALGVDGADKLSGAKNIGSKIALGASGLLAARWAAKKGGKLAIEKAPLVGTDAWKRRGQNIAAAWNIGSAKRAERWDAGIAKRFGDTGVGGFIGNRLKSKRFKAKVASDWKKAAESAEQIYDTAISTGKTSAGSMKLDLGERAAMSRERDESAGANKRAEKRAQILAAEAELAKPILEEAERKKQAIAASGLTGDEKKAAEKQLADETEVKLKESARYLEYETEKVNKAGKARERQIESKGYVLEHGRLDSKYAIQYEQELYEEREKEFANLRPSEFLGKAKVYAEQIRTTQDPAEKKKLRERARALLIAAQKKGSFEAGEVLKGFAQAIGSDASGLNTNETKGMQQFMSRALGYGQDNFADMQNEMSIAEQRQFQVSAETMAMDGDTRTVTLFSKMYDPALQRERLAVNTNYAVPDDEDETIGRAEYVNLSKVTGSDGLVSVMYDANGKQSARITNDKDVKRLIATYKSMKQNTRLTSSNKSSLKALMKASRDANDGKWDNFMSQLQTESKQAFEALQKEIEGVQAAPPTGNPPTPPPTP